MPGELIAIPYCGSAPSPAELWTRWNLDPYLLITLAAVAACHLAACRRATPPAAPDVLRRVGFVAGWSTLTLALISPLCALSVSLFSARVGQHMLMLFVAAPLLVMASPDVFRRALGPGGAVLVFTAVLWGWHAPAPYRATFQSDVTYWLMHASLFAAALPLWRHVLAPGRRGSLVSIVVAFVTVLQTGLLGALITFAPTAFYEPHFATSADWGLSPLEDQQLGGLIMWIPGSVLLLIPALLSAARLLKSPPPQRGSLDPLAGPR